MKKIIKTALLSIALFNLDTAKAQLSGSYAVPGTFTSIAAAINSLNISGVSGSVTIDISAGYTETVTAGGFTLNAIVGASSTNQIIFQKSGTGADPILYAYAGGTATPSSAIQDGVWRFVGTDFVTVNGIDIIDPNTANPATMEFGFGFFKASVANGCQNNTIINCSIILNRINNAAGSGPAVDGSRGIDVVSSGSVHTTVLTPTNAAGSNSNNKFYSNTIENCNIGIAIIGFAASSPFTLADTGNDIGGTSSATGNTIINFGGGGTTSTSTGIRTLAQYGLNISFNNINNNNGSGINHAASMRGILIGAATSANAIIASNTLSIKGGGTTQQISVIENASGSTAASNTVAILNNLISNCTYSTSTSATFYYIQNSGAPLFLSISGNTITNNNIAGTGTHYGMETGSPTSALLTNNFISNNLRSASNASFGTTYCMKTTSPTSLTVISNTVELDGFSAPASTGAVYGFYGLSSSVNVTITANIIRNLSVSGAGNVYGIREWGVSGAKIISNNEIYNFSSSAGAGMYGIYCSTGNIQINNNSIYTFTSTGGSGGTFAGIYISGGTTNTVFKNKIYDLSSGSTSPFFNGIYISGGTTNTLQNNLVGDLRTPNANSALAIYGISIDGGTTANLFYNTVYLNAISTGTLFGSTAFYASTSPNVNALNNIFVNNSSFSGAGITSAYRRSSTTLTSYSISSNNNLFYAGSPGVSNVIFFNGTTTYSTLNTFKILLGNRDQQSITENVSFASLAGSNPNFLNINTLTPTQIESAGVPISGITDDFAGTTRNATTPDIGAFEGTYTPASACSGAPSPISLISTQSAVCPSVSFNIGATGSYTETGIAYEWQASTTSSTTGFSAVSGASLAIFTNTNLAATTWYQLAVTCTNSASGFTTTPVLVTAGPPVLNALSSATFICANQSSNFSLSSPVSGVLYQWLTSTTASNTGYSAITNATLATRTNSGSVGTNWFTAVLSCTANPTFSTAANPVSVLVGAVPTASASASSPTICSGSGINLFGSSDIATLYSWTGPASFTSSSQNPTVASPVSGIYSLISSFNTCSSIASTVAVNILGTLFSSAPVATPSSICLGNTSQLTSVYPSVRVNKYNFTPSTGASLVTLTTGSVSVIGSSIDDAPMATPAAIGFNFNYNGTTYSQFTASPDGWVMLGSATGVNEFTNLVTATNNIPKLYPYWDDLATGTSGYVRTQLFGSAPSRTLVIEWFVTIPRNTTGAANSTFQALLFEVNGAVEFRYGTMGSGSMSASSGLTGDATTFNCLTLVGSSNSTAVANNTNAIQPPTGTSYLFTIPTITYSWSPSAGLSSTSLPSVTATPVSSTIYSLNLGFEGCATTRTVSVNVTNPPVLTIVPSNAEICPGASATLTANGAATYSWDSGSTSTVIVVTPTANLTSYSVQGVTGPCTSTQTIVISIPGNPTINISGSSGICTGQTATLLASGASTYSWNTGATTNSITDTPVSNTTYTVVGTNTLGCSTTTTQLVTVAASLSISILGPSTICLGQAANLTGNGGVTYTWSTGAFTSTIAPSPTTTTTYSVIGASGTCSNTALTIISVNPNPTISVSGNSVICADQTATLTASGAATYSWSNGALTAAAALSPTSNTNYTVTGTSGAGCPTSVTTAVVSNSVPIITIASSSGTVCALSPASFTASGATTYSWVSGPNNAVYTLTPAATAIYTVNATNALLCTSSKTVSLATFSLPVLGITPSSATVCSLAQANFTAIGASTYTWNNAISGATISLTPTLATTYSVTGTSAQGCISSATVGVVTNTLPVLNISPPSTTVCSFATVGFTASGASTYTWNNSSSFIGASFSSAPGNNITYTVVGTNTLGCSSSNTVAVATLSLPLVVITPSFATLCTLSTGIFTASGATSYTWSNATNASTVALSAATTTVYSVSGTDVNGCVSGNQIVLLTNPLPTLAVTPNSATVCPNVGQTFGASGATTYTWSSGTNSSSAVIVTAASSVYTVSGSDVNGCVGSATLAIITKTVPVIIVTPSSASVCLSASASFSASGANSYTWSNGSNFSGITVSPLVSTVYTVNAKGNSGCNGSTTVNLVVWQPPVINITASSLTVCARETITLTASGASTYTWFPFNLSGATLTNNPTFTLDYKVNATDINGCQNSDTITVFVDKCTGISKNNLSSEFVRIYPNPSTGFINASFGFEGSKEIKVLNSLGAFVMKIVTEDQSVAFDLSGYAKGVYFINVRTNGTYTNYKVIIQ